MSSSALKQESGRELYTENCFPVARLFSDQLPKNQNKNKTNLTNRFSIDEFSIFHFFSKMKMEEQESKGENDVKISQLDVLNQHRVCRVQLFRIKVDPEDFESSSESEDENVDFQENQTESLDKHEIQKEIETANALESCRNLGKEKKSLSQTSDDDHSYSMVSLSMDR